MEQANLDFSNDGRGGRGGRVGGRGPRPRQQFPQPPPPMGAPLLPGLAAVPMMPMLPVDDDEHGQRRRRPNPRREPEQQPQQRPRRSKSARGNRGKSSGGGDPPRAPAASKQLHADAAEFVPGKGIASVPRAVPVRPYGYYQQPQMSFVQYSPYGFFPGPPDDMFHPSMDDGTLGPRLPPPMTVAPMPPMMQMHRDQPFHPTAFQQPPPPPPLPPVVQPPRAPTAVTPEPPVVDEASYPPLSASGPPPAPDKDTQASFLSVAAPQPEPAAPRPEPAADVKDDGDAKQPADVEPSADEPVADEPGESAPVEQEARQVAAPADDAAEAPEADDPPADPVTTPPVEEVATVEEPTVETSPEEPGVAKTDGVEEPHKNGEPVEPAAEAVVEAPTAEPVAEAVVEQPAAPEPEQPEKPVQAKQPLAEPNSAAKPAVTKPVKKSAKKRAAGYENRSGGDMLDAFLQKPAEEDEEAKTEAPVIEEPQPAPEPAVEEPPEETVADNWEEDGAAGEASPTEVDASPAEARSSSPELATSVDEPVQAGRRMYSKYDLLSVREAMMAAGGLAEPPPGLPSFLLERPSSTQEPGRRRLGPGGSARVGGGPAAGGGSASTNDLGDARRSAPIKGGRQDDHYHHRNNRGGGYSDHGTWARGQKVKGGDKDGLGPSGPVEPLKTSAYRWDPKKLKKAADATAAAVARVTAILNKMTPENFEKLSTQLMALDMISSEMLQKVIEVLFEKAVDEPHFAVVYAELCAKMATDTTKVWPFIRIVRDDTNDEWSWVADLDVETSKVLPIQGDAQAASELLEEIVKLDDALYAEGEEVITGSDNRAAREAERLSKSGGSDAHLDDVLPEAVGVGQLKLEAADCLVREDRVLVCFTAPQRPGVLFAVLVDASMLFASALHVFGGFSSKEDAQAGAMKKASFKRLLLNQCEEQFKRVAKSGEGAAALAEMATEAMEAQAAATKKAKEDAEAAGLPAPIPPDELTHEDWVGKLKRRMLGIVRFIGELFKMELLKEKIMHLCVRLLLGNYLDDPTITPDDESVEAAAKLFLTIGKLLESPPSSKAKLDDYFKRFSVLSKDKRIAARTRFMLQDLAETRKNHWRPRHQKDGPHKLNNQPTAQQQAQQRNSEQQRELTRQRMRESQDARRQQAGAPSQPAARRGPAPQDFRILARENSDAKSSSSRSPPQQQQPAPSATDTKKRVEWTDERIANRVKSCLDEHAEQNDDVELLVSFDEMPARGARVIAEKAFQLVAEGKDKQRVGALDTLVALIVATPPRLRQEHVHAAFEGPLTELPDLVVDAPKALDHVASLCAALLLFGALDVAWLCASKGRRLGYDEDDDDIVPTRPRFFRLVLTALPKMAAVYNDQKAALRPVRRFFLSALTTFAGRRLSRIPRTPRRSGMRRRLQCFLCRVSSPDPVEARPLDDQPHRRRWPLRSPATRFVLYNTQSRRRRRRRTSEP